MKIFIGADHRGYEMKKQLAEYLKGKGMDVLDLGTFSEDKVDYVDIAREVAEKVQENDGANGILLCGSGIGVTIAANKVQKIRAALVNSVERAKTAREHDWANVLCMAAEDNSLDNAKAVVDTFLATKYIDGDDGRYKRRADKVNEMG